jgi:hypothetical protein
MSMPFRWVVAAPAFALMAGHLAAEVPPLPKSALEARADLIVTGTVTAVSAGDKSPPRYGEKETEYRLTVEFSQVEKGALKGGARSLVARGSSYTYRPGNVGTGGHYSDNTNHRIAAVEKGWELTLYLTAAADGTFEIVAPNGFAVRKSPGR